MISWVTAAVAGAAGLVAGDYATVVIERAPADRTVAGSLRELGRHPAGECPRCAVRLRAADLIPLAGWARTGGICRYCGQRFGAWHPAAEILTALLFALIGLRFGASPVLPAFCYLAAVSVALAFIDVAHRRLPDVLTLPSYPVAVAALAVATPFVPQGAGHFIDAAIGLACASAFYLILALVYPVGIGWATSSCPGCSACIWAGSASGPWSSAWPPGSCWPPWRDWPWSRPGRRPVSRSSRSARSCWPAP